MIPIPAVILLAVLMLVLLPRITTWDQPEVYVQSEALWEMLDYYQGLADHVQDEILAELTPYQRGEFEKMDARYRDSGDIPRRMVTPQVIEGIDHVHKRLLALSMEAHLVLFNALDDQLQNLVLEAMGDGAGGFCSLNNLWLDRGMLPADQSHLWSARNVRAAADETLARYYYELDNPLWSHICHEDIQDARARGLVFSPGGYMPENPVKTLTGPEAPLAPENEDLDHQD